ncbi:Hsp20/alpha crystallin family protein [Solitalea koreensis]|uniref:HSP20 family protein n=1 Tax=Solitalea koreensis TaxID=543615 RepID=A0A521BKY5_9SPHI|nr:Hsp20/alpha crystallin family protein [Solitalea koreensis]SMO47759.1 HSP20 family protein [Solitalea koreensis]
MTVIKWNAPAKQIERVSPFAPMFNDIFDSLFNGGLIQPKNISPAVNVIESANGFTVELAAPGLKKDDFKIDLEKNTLTISADKENEITEETKNYHRREFSFSSFMRSFNLPESVDHDAISAEYIDGVLHLNIPKKAEAQGKPKQIKIS